MPPKKATKVPPTPAADPNKPINEDFAGLLEALDKAIEVHDGIPEDADPTEPGKPLSPEEDEAFKAIELAFSRCFNSPLNPTEIPTWNGNFGTFEHCLKLLNSVQGMEKILEEEGVEITMVTDKEFEKAMEARQENPDFTFDFMSETKPKPEPEPETAKEDEGKCPLSQMDMLMLVGQLAKMEANKEDSAAEAKE